jgi:hypothetical protein
VQLPSLRKKFQYSPKLQQRVCGVTESVYRAK